jgi:cellulose synthase/poly-beta-1,6-N-acetylglucosamine synthase-like glycosyltransferase
VDVLLPVYEEAALIAEKLGDLAALEYPDGLLRFLVLDGGSRDRTVESIVTFSARDARFNLVRTGLANKVAQLNAGLRRSRTGWVLVTDADARLEPDTLLRLMCAALGDRSLGVVGPPVMPVDAHPVERLHWTLSNWLRHREDRCGSASMVAGPCYLFRREVLDAFPEDVVADDVHVACRAAMAGLRTAIAGPVVEEVRTPRTVISLVVHKVRKTDAYLREVFRFLPAAHRMSRPMRAVFLWRAAVLTIAPMLAVVAGALICLGTNAGIIATVLIVAVLAAGGGPGWLSRGAAVSLLPAVLAVTSFVALLAQPFSRQTASYPKVAQPERQPEAAE